jgi:hypothetical protein
VATARPRHSEHFAVVVFTFKLGLALDREYSAGVNFFLGMAAIVSPS